MSLEQDSLSGLSLQDLQLIRDRIRDTKINVLLVGGTGVGKSSTINALFKIHGLESNAKIGDKTEPETMDVSKHELGNLIIWDTPGVGDGPEKDAVHQKKIIELLNRKDDKEQPVIDLVFLILDSSSRDFSSAFALIKNVILPNLSAEDRNRILIGLNQADQAMKGHYWDKAENKPEPKLIERLDELTLTVKERIKLDTGLDVEPIYYSAGCVLDGEALSSPYNLQKLLSFILDRLPSKKRVAIAQYVNPDEENFRSNDENENYQAIVEASILGSVMEYVKELASEFGNTIKAIVTNPENIKKAGIFLMASVVSWIGKKDK